LAIVPKPEKIHAFAHAKDFETWLKRHFDKEDELYLRIYKKGSGVESVTYAEALDVALCWGWIDGLKKSYDAASFLQRFTPRKAKSMWSQINREHVARLIEEGRMRPGGHAEVERARADGRWDAAYRQKDAVAPPDLQIALDNSPDAAAFFNTLSKIDRFRVYFRIGNIKTPAVRAARIRDVIEKAERGEQHYR
jgi:uncharacterized protein YdeI (YjbR/CyaY-like superfamily)